MLYDNFKVGDAVKYYITDSMFVYYGTITKVNTLTVRIKTSTGEYKVTKQLVNFD
jgi:small-conductance mechanosensitive channel